MIKKRYILKTFSLMRYVGAYLNCGGSAQHNCYFNLSFFTACPPTADWQRVPSSPFRLLLIGRESKTTV